MARRKGLLHAMAQSQKEAERRRNAEMRLQAQAARAAERERKAQQRALIANLKERERMYAESRVAEAAQLNDDLESEIDHLQRTLSRTLTVDDYFDLDALKEPLLLPSFDPGVLGVPEVAPSLEDYLPADASVFKRLLPGAKEKHSQEVAEAKLRFEADVEAYEARENQRKQALQRLRDAHDQRIDELRTKHQAQHDEIESFKRDLAAGVPTAVIEYCTLVLEQSEYPDSFPQHAKLAYVPESKQLVIEYDLPTFDVVPDVASYKYVKARDEIATSARPQTQRRALYTNVIAQVTLRTLHEMFEADRHDNIDTIVFNGYVETVDAGTGRMTRPCLITVRTTREAFASLDLSRVDPVACLKVLNASVSKSPTELAPVRPVLEFSMVDPRFIEETDVISGLDQRPNLMELTPSEFEALISNLFQKMGLETRLTQASRDGGVDCVAYDPRPIFGGKVVIQAKRYKDTVGVSAVRDLYGTMQNEGATKGILVATSGYGKAAFEFAEGKPLELLSGSNLLHLLAEHAGIEARIEIPDA